jgi:hypothetical protein
MEAVSVFKLEAGKAGTRTTAPKPIATPAIAHRAQASLQDEKRLSGHPKERKLIKAKQDTDGEWKEF